MGRIEIESYKNKTTGFPPFFQTFERNNSIRSNNVVQLIGSENLLIFDDSYGKMVDDEKENITKKSLVWQTSNRTDGVKGYYNVIFIIKET